MEDAKLEELELQPVAFSDVLLLLLLVWFVLVYLPRYVGACRRRLLEEAALKRS